MYRAGVELLWIPVALLRSRLLQRQYRSAYSLEVLYPNSRADYSGSGGRQQGQDGALHNSYSTDIPVDRLTVTYCRSSGPGGQNVNKVNTKAEVRFHVATADWLPEDVRSAITAKHQNRINRAGQLIVTSEASRYQMRNLANCLQKIRDIVAAASQKPKQSSKEEAENRRMRVESMQRERLRQKRIQSAIKRDRRVGFD
ncbi:peptidyl-tRNA hydrolase ICT1, mitochondrial [Carcharodon carcharias]|uniref:peptidyl-tRNA hydrolase ICT1, mitochondrial n=1 Tax=Carcharodon carcharias TaxID=13397 RepID=UPI001B7E4C0B|nr:peptidyl-tRNA hydrolase ICT1, mitochondrial [Carcharodon carcharias]